MKRSMIGYASVAPVKSAVHKPRRLLPETFVNSEGRTVPMEISVPINIIEDIIQQDLKCPICLGTIQQTSSVTACLHRFCEDCLHKSLRGNLNSAKEHHDCPSCRFKLPSKRSTRADSDFDSIIQVIAAAMERHQPKAPAPQPTRREVSSTRSKAPAEDEDEEFDIREFQRSHQAAIAEFRAKQQTKKKEAQLQLRMLQQQLLLQRQVSSPSNKKSSTKHPQQHQHSLSHSNNGKGNNSKKVSSPAPVVEAQPRINLAVFPFTSVDDHIHGHELLHLKTSLTGKKRPRSPSLSEGAASMTDLTSLDNVNVLSVSSAVSPLPPVELPYLRVPPTLTVLALKQYISARLTLTLEEVNRLEFVFIDVDPATTSPQDTVQSTDNVQKQDTVSRQSPTEPLVIALDEQMAMSDVVSIHWRGRGKFHLYYRLKPVLLPQEPTTDQGTETAPSGKEDKHETHRILAVDGVVVDNTLGEANVSAMDTDEVAEDSVPHNDTTHPDTEQLNEEEENEEKEEEKEETAEDISD